MSGMHVCTLCLTIETFNKRLMECDQLNYVIAKNETGLWKIYITQVTDEI